MKEISKEEFEENIEDLIQGKITKVKLAKKLETDPRTLDNKIQALSVSNIDLYERYISVLPYKQKGYDHIDFKALVIHILKQGITVDEAIREFGTSRRTLQRKVNDLEDKELVEMYKEAAENKKCSRKNSAELERRIQKLEERPVVIGEINDRRKSELLKIEEEFNRLCKTMTQEEAAKKMGYEDRSRVYKLLNELYKLEIEEEHKHNPDFREKLKVNLANQEKSKEQKDEVNTKELSEKTQNQTEIEGR